RGSTPPLVQKLVYQRDRGFRAGSELLIGSHRGKPPSPVSGREPPENVFAKTRPRSGPASGFPAQVQTRKWRRAHAALPSSLTDAIRRRGRPPFGLNVEIQPPR